MREADQIRAEQLAAELAAGGLSKEREERKKLELHDTWYRSMQLAKREKKANDNEVDGIIFYQTFVAALPEYIKQKAVRCGGCFLLQNILWLL